MEHPDEYRRIAHERIGPAPRTPEAWVDAYVSLRKALGFHTRDVRGVLGSLCRFMRAHDLTSFGQIDRADALFWLHQGHVQEVRIGGRLCAVRGLFRYLRSLGAVRLNVWDSFTCPRPKHFIPHIFTIAEIRTILQKTLHMDDPRMNRSPWIQNTYRVAFHTTYACGLRVGEICRLKIGDVDFERSVLTVRKTKFGKTRLVPFNVRTRELLARYLERFRPGDCPKSADSPFFVTLRRRPFSVDTTSGHFSTVCAAAGLHRRKRTKGDTVHGGTTIHALRHSFAVHRLVKWYEEGVDVNSKLPLLATYMGHTDYRYTQKYLTVLPIITDMAGKRFAEMFEKPLRDLERPDGR
jgi:integrase/recombinase XerD